MRVRMNDHVRGMVWALLGVVVLAAPVAAGVDLPCPGCESGAPFLLSAGELLELALSTLLRKGISLLVLGAAAVVALPWMVAGLAVALVALPRWLRASS